MDNTIHKEESRGALAGDCRPGKMMDIEPSLPFTVYRLPFKQNLTNSLSLKILVHPNAQLKLSLCSKFL
jgi:hypothetical protein